jgi:hypothetical protein
LPVSFKLLSKNTFVDGEVWMPLSLSSCLPLYSLTLLLSLSSSLPLYSLTLLLYHSLSSSFLSPLSSFLFPIPSFLSPLLFYLSYFLFLSPPLPPFLSTYSSSIVGLAGHVPGDAPIAELIPKRK